MSQCFQRYEWLCGTPTNVWKEALDGFVALGGSTVQRALQEERGALSQDAKAKVKREWIDEAIEQIQSSADPG